VAEESQFEISTAIRIKPGRPAQFSGLSEHLRDDDAFHRAIEMLQMVPPEIDESGLSQQLKMCSKGLSSFHWGRAFGYFVRYFDTGALAGNPRHGDRVKPEHRVEWRLD
jgi:hypothetical protein